MALQDGPVHSQMDLLPKSRNHMSEAAQPPQFLIFELCPHLQIIRSIPAHLMVPRVRKTCRVFFELSVIHDEQFRILKSVAQKLAHVSCLPSGQGLWSSSLDPLMSTTPAAAGFASPSENRFESKVEMVEILKSCHVPHVVVNLVNPVIAVLDGKHIERDHRDLA